MNKKKKVKRKSLADRIEQKKLAKASKQRKNLYKCNGGGHNPAGCGHEWSVPYGKEPPGNCPKCQSQYFTWINYKHII